jgi:response regulator NasT
VPLGLGSYVVPEGAAHLDDRKLIERAKGALMRRLGVDEEEAFCRLRMASSKNMKLVEMAKQIIAAEAVFAELAG